MAFDNGKHDLGDEYIAWLKEHGPEVLQAALNEDKLAERIVSTYTLYYQRPEHIAAALLESMIDSYRERQ